MSTGEMLGEWTDELGEGIFIKKWLSIGPKSYSYETNNGKKTTKVKGFTLHHKNTLEINDQAMEQLIDGIISKVVVVDNQIIRDKTTKQLINKKQPKTFSFDFDKRTIKQNYNTYPYDYIHQ